MQQFINECLDQNLILNALLALQMISLNVKNACNLLYKTLLKKIIKEKIIE